MRTPTSEVYDRSLLSVLFCMLQGSGDLVETRGGGCSSKNALLLSP